MRNLFTKTQRRILTFIQESIVNRGKAPTCAEIAEFLGVSSVGTVSHYLKQMEEQGMLERSGQGAARNIVVSTQPLELLDRMSLKAMKVRGVALSSIIREWSSI
jgi:SOS-response transcriptional repressor LexA